MRILLALEGEERRPLSVLPEEDLLPPLGGEERRNSSCAGRRGKQASFGDRKTRTSGMAAFSGSKALGHGGLARVKSLPPPACPGRRHVPGRSGRPEEPGARAAGLACP